MVDSDYSFYRLYPQKVIKPKIFYETPLGKTTLDPNAMDHGNKIEYKTPKPKALPTEKPIELENIENKWKNGHYGTEDNLNTNPFRTQKELDEWYLSPHEVPFYIETPLYVPSNKIFLNNKQGLETQWKLFLDRTRK